MKIVPMTWYTQTGVKYSPLSSSNQKFRMTIAGEDIMQPFSGTFTAALIVASSVAMLGVAHTWADDSPPPPKLRLPADVVAPVRYRVELTVIPDQDTFSGTVEIDLRFAKSTPFLWLNAEKLTVKEATLKAERRKPRSWMPKLSPSRRTISGFVLRVPSVQGKRHSECRTRVRSAARTRGASSR